MKTFLYLFLSLMLLGLASGCGGDKDKGMNRPDQRKDLPVLRRRKIKSNHLQEQIRLAAANCRAATVRGQVYPHFCMLAAEAITVLESG